VEADDLHVGAFVDVHRGGLGDEQAAGPQERGGPVQEGSWVAADADVAVHEEDGAPAALARQRCEDRAPQCPAAEPQGVVDGCAADVDAEGHPSAQGEFGHQPSGSASHVEDGSLAAVQGVPVDRVRPGAPAFHLQWQQPAVGAAQEQRAAPRAQGGGVGVGGGPGGGGGGGGGRRGGGGGGGGAGGGRASGGGEGGAGGEGSGGRGAGGGGGGLGWGGGGAGPGAGGGGAGRGGRVGVRCAGRRCATGQLGREAAVRGEGGDGVGVGGGVDVAQGRQVPYPQAGGEEPVPLRRSGRRGRHGDAAQQGGV